MKAYNLFIFISIFAITATYTNAAATDTLTLNSCIALALKNHPLRMNAEGVAQVAEGAFYSSRSPLFPQISGQIQSSQLHPQNFDSPGKKNLPQYAGSITLQQLIFDFGRTPAKTAAGRLAWDASKADSQNIRQNIIYSAITSYFAVAQARAILHLSKNSYKQSIEHFLQTQNLFSSGRGIRYSVVRAQIDTLSARLNFLRAQNSVSVAIEQLSSLISKPLSDSVFLSDTTTMQSDVVPIDSALTVALENRSDLKAAHLRIRSMEKQIIASQKSYLPSLSLNATTGYRLTYSDTTPYFNGAVLLSIPILSGGAVRGTIVQNTGNLKVAKSAASNLEQAIQLEIKQQYLMLDEIQERILLAKIMVDQASLALSLAKDRYSAGSGSSLEMIDAETGYTNAGMSRIQAQYEYAVAVAKLHKILGILETPSER